MRPTILMCDAIHGEEIPNQFCHDTKRYLLKLFLDHNIILPKGTMIQFQESDRNRFQRCHKKTKDKFFEWIDFDPRDVVEIDDTRICFPQGTDWNIEITYYIK